jgi:hypothetical protein
MPHRPKLLIEKSPAQSVPGICQQRVHDPTLDGGVDSLDAVDLG